MVCVGWFRRDRDYEKGIDNWLLKNDLNVKGINSQGTWACMRR